MAKAVIALQLLEGAIVGISEMTNVIVIAAFGHRTVASRAALSCRDQSRDDGSSSIRKDFSWNFPIITASPECVCARVVLQKE